VNVKAAGEALPGSIAGAATGMWDAVMNYDKVIAHIKERGFKGVVEDIGTDLKDHYGSIDRAQKTFETDPFRFVMDIASLGSGVGTLAKLGIGTVGRIAESAIPSIAGKATKMGAEPFERAAQAGRAGPASWAGREYSAALGGQPSPVQQAVQGASAAPALGAMRAAQPFQQGGQAIRQGGWMPQRFQGPASVGALMDIAGAHGLGSVAGAAGIAASSPRLAGAAAYGAGRMGAALPSARGAGTAGLLAGGTLTREAIQKQAADALKDKEFKKNAPPEDIKTLRKVRQANADSKAMQAAQRVLGGYRPLQLTVRPEQGGYGGSEGGQSNDATSGVVSRQEGGPVAPGRAYSVGDAPGASADTPKPETFVPDRGPSPAQAAGGAATEAVGWVSDAWASILKGEKPPPLPGLPETGKVPSTADPRPTQALGEETSFLSQFAGPPGAAAAKGLGAAALGAAAGKKLLKGAAEEGAEMAGKGIRAYHGSPHEFERFSTEKIGTGEGAQAYGHGLYFAENPKVAEEYKRSLAKATIDDKSLDQFLSDTPKIDTVYDAHRHLKTIHDRAIPIEEATKFYDTSSIPAERRVAEAVNTYGSLDNARRMMNKSDVPILEKMIKSGRLKEGSGKTYEVNIKAEREHFLDWDKPLSEQSPKVQKAITSLFKGHEEILDALPKSTGEIIMQRLMPMAGHGRDIGGPSADMTAEVLRKLDIPGIKYLDQGSRAGKEGTSNFVVFNDALIDIVRKYGIAAIAAIPPALALKNETTRNR